MQIPPYITMNAYMLVPLIFSPSHRRTIYEKESHPAKALPALPRLWLPITPYKYITVPMETRRHKNTWIHACECMHTRKRSFMRRLWCFAFPQQEASCWSSGAEGRGKAAVLQCDHDSICWTLQDKGPRGDKLGMEGTEDRQEVLVQSKNYPAAGVETELALQVLHTPTRTVLPAPFWSNFHTLGVPVHPAWKTALPKSSWGRNTWWTWPSGYQPTGCKMQMVKVNSTNTQWLKILPFQHLEVVRKFSLIEKELRFIR